MNARRASKVAGEDGFTLVELLVAILVMTVVMIITATAVVSAMRNQERQVSYSEALRETQTAFERVTRDLRAADPVLDAQGDEVGLAVFRSGGCQQVTYVVDDGVLTNATTGQWLVLGLSYGGGDDPFSYEDSDGQPVTDPTDVRAITVRLRRPVPGTEAVVDLRDRVVLRNRGVPRC